MTNDELTQREKVERHLRTWTKKQLITQLALCSKQGWLDKWADEYDESNK